MSIFSRIFKSNKEEEPKPNPETSSQDVFTEQLCGEPVLCEDANDAAPIRQIPDSIPAAILDVVEERGEDFLSNPILINILDDYHLFAGQRALKNSLKLIQSGNYIRLILDSVNWEIDNQSIVQRICQELGLQMRFAKYLTASLGYGLGHTSVLPVLEDSDSNVIPEENASEVNIENESQQTPPARYNPGSELANYKKPVEIISDGVCSLFDTLKKYDSSENKLPVIIQDESVVGVPGIFDLTNGPHMLIGGATLAGKSTLIHSMIATLLFHKHPSELKLVLMDGKGLEFGCYEDLENHFLAKLPNEADSIITESQPAIDTLNSLALEIENRWDLLKNARTRNIESYNNSFTSRKLNPADGHRYLPFIVLVIDEYSPFMSKEFEKAIVSIGQKGATVGVHMILATSQVDKDILSLQIRQQFQQRIAFKTLSVAASRLLLNNGNSTKLSPKGKVIWGDTGGEGIEMQTPDYSYDSISELVACIHDQEGYAHPYILPEYSDIELDIPMVSLTDLDPLLPESSRYFMSTGFASASTIQRRYNIGYNRAGKILDQLEALGIVGPSLGGKPRAVLVNSQQLESILKNL